METGNAPDLNTVLKNTIVIAKDLRATVLEYAYLLDDVIDNPAQAMLLAKVDELLAELDRALDK